ncbi:MAG: SUMF1/EgtB/PvdO family nonheme iron enzyme [Oscillatoria sp. SIO1A7]|nr:SUMF1/EgtB/PvdO family nonheme iron enzyme [Oscillatoria sp. SIO1A7]
MSLCINPHCSQPQNPDDSRFCQGCGSELLIRGRYRVARLYKSFGGLGSIYEAIENDSAKILEVLINNDPKAVELLQRTSEALNQIKHPGVPQIREYFHWIPKDSKTPLHCLALERIEGIDLQQYIEQQEFRPLEQKIALSWLSQLLKIIQEISDKQFSHWDIKPSNIIRRPNSEIALINFGAARQGKKIVIYTPGYAAPEQEKGQAVLASDFFALGRTFVYLLTGKHPNDQVIYDNYEDILNWRSHAPNLSSQFAELLEELMEPDADKRPDNPREILQRLNKIKAILYPPPAQVFEYEVAMLNERGRETHRTRKTAEYRPEYLGKGSILEMVFIPGGTFKMGSPDTEKQRHKDEGPQHLVTVAPFFMGKFMVTQAQWRAVAALPEVNFALNPNPSNNQGDFLPVEGVTWDEAMEFCARLYQKTGRNYRLPTEAEWEYACRAGTTTPFHFGETINPDLANYNATHSYGFGPKGGQRQGTTVVGAFEAANPFGLYDMHGNIWEWCADPWHGDYVGAPSDGRVWESEPSNNRRVLRGGVWYGTPLCCRSAFRDRDDKDTWWSLYGFRVALSSF